MSIFVSWIELELSATITRRSALASFDLVHDGKTYFADGLLADVLSTKRVLSLENVPQEVVLNLVDKNGNTDMRDAVRDGTYRRRKATVYKGKWNTTTATLSNVETLKQGPMETVNDVEDNGTVTLIVSSQLVDAQKSTENIALDLLHSKRIQDGIYGSSVADKARVDNIFVNATRDFDDVKFGKFALIETKYKSRNILQKAFGVPAAIKSNQKPKRTGSIVESAGTDFQPAKVYGSAQVDARVINAWNPTPAEVFAAYGGSSSSPVSGYNFVFNPIGSGSVSTYVGSIAGTGQWYGERYPNEVDGVEENSRFVSVQYAVASDKIDKLEIFFEGLNYSGSVSEQVIRLVAPATILPNSTSVGSITGTVNGQTVISGIIQVQWASHDQIALSQAVDTSNGLITAKSRGIGYVIVTAVYEATRSGGILSNGFPNPKFMVTQRDTREFGSVTLTAPLDPIFGTSNYTPADFYDRSTAQTCSIGYGTTRPSVPSPYNMPSLWTQAGEVLDVTFSSTIQQDILDAWDLPTASGEYIRRVTWSDPSIGEDRPDYIYLEQGANYSYAKISTVMFPDIVNQPNTVRFLFSYLTTEGTVGELPAVGQFDLALPLKIQAAKRNDHTVNGLSSVKSDNNRFNRVLVDFLTDPICGPGFLANDLDAESFFNADRALRVPKQAHGVMQGRSSYTDYIEDIQDSSGLIVYEELGKIRCFFREPLESSDIQHQFTDANSEYFKFVGERNADRYNRFTLDYTQYIDEGLRVPQQNGEAIVVFNNTYITEDLLQDSEGDIDCPYLSAFAVEDTPGVLMPSRIYAGSPLIETFTEYALYLMDKSRLSDEIEARVRYSDAYGLLLGKPFSINTEKYGWTGLNERIFLCSEIEDTHDGFVTITGQPHSNSLFGWADSYPGIIAREEWVRYSEYTGITQPLQPQIPTSLQASYNTADQVVELSWVAPTNGPTDQYLLEYKLSTETVFKTVSVGPSVSATHNTGANAATYQYRVRTQEVGGTFSDYTAIASATVTATQQAEALQPRFDTTLITFDSTTLVSADADADLTVLSGESLATLSTAVTDPAMLNNTWRLKSATISNGFSVSTLNQVAAKSVKITASGFIADTSSVITCTIAYKGSTGVVVDLILKLDVVASTRNPPVITTTLTSTTGTVFRSDTSATVLQINVFLDGVLSTNHDDYTYSWQVLNSSNAKKVVIVSNALDSNGNPQLLNDTVAGGPLLAIGDPSTIAGRQGLTAPAGSSGLPADSLCTLTVAVPAVADELRRLAVGAEDVDNFQQFTCNVGNIPD